MLILSRKPNESVIIGLDGTEEPIEIVVTELAGNQVRLGIQAPKGYKIWRKELFLTIEYNKQAAAAASAAGIRGVASKLTGKTTSAAKPPTEKPEAEKTSD